MEDSYHHIGERKKSKNQLNRENQKKKIIEKTEPRKKNQLNLLEF